MANGPYVSRIGSVSAYLDAVAHGFTGTREEFGELLANAGNYFQRAESAAERAEQYGTAAVQAASEADASKETAINAASIAEGASQTATAAAQGASQSAQAAAGDAQTAASASDDALRYMNNAGQFATNADISAQEARGYRDTADEDAATASAAAEAAAVSEENAAASEQHAQELVDSLPSDYADLLQDIVKMKLLSEYVMNTTQKYTFSEDGKTITRVEHVDSGNVAVRTDVYTYGETQIIETRTLRTGANVTITTNLTTLETSVVYATA